MTGSSGRVDVPRARLFCSSGLHRGRVALVLAAPVRFQELAEIPLETFTAAITRLVQQGCERIVLVGTSKGAEAALLTAVYDSRVAAVVAISPSSVVWGQYRPRTGW